MGLKTYVIGAIGGAGLGGLILAILSMFTAVELVNAAFYGGVFGGLAGLAGKNIYRLLQIAADILKAVFG